MSTNPFRNLSTYKVDPLSEIRNAGIITNGEVYWVSSASDAKHRDRIDALGRKVVKVNAQAAIDVTKSDNNDYILVVPTDGGSVLPLGTALDLNEDRVHLFAAGFGKAKRTYTVTFRSSQGTVPDTELLAVTGHGCQIGGLRFLGTLGTNAGGTMSNGVAFISGDDFWAHDCVFEDSTNIWGTPSVVRGDGTGAHDARFDDCAFAISGTGNVESAGNAPMVIAGNGNKRWQLNDCVYTMPAGSTTETFFSGGTGATETTILRRNHFGLTNGTTHAVTSAIRGSVTANNPILAWDCSALSVTQIGTDPNVFVAPAASGTRALVYNPGLAIGTAALVAA